MDVPLEVRVLPSRRDGRFALSVIAIATLAVLAVHFHLSLIERILGVVVSVWALVDIFLTVLYARIGTGIMSDHVASWTWRAFMWASPRSSPRRGHLLSFCGPVIVVLVFAGWASGLTLGSAMILHPSLGTSVQASSGAIHTDFSTAMYASGNSLAVVGSAGFVPKTVTMRMVFLFNSLVGMSGLSLVLTYLMQIYSALQRRNVLGRTVHLLTRETGDAAELVAALGPEGQFESGMADLTSLASDLTAIGESHHFYPILVYFRFPEPLYAVSRFALVALDAVTLMKTALDPQRCGWLTESGSIEQLWRASLLLVTTLEETFLPHDPAHGKLLVPGARMGQPWRARYLAALKRLRRARIPTVTDEREGANAYEALRSRWQSHIETLAPSLAYSMADVDPAAVGANGGD